MKAIDTYWICTAEHGLNASTFTARIVASTGADCGAAMSGGRRRAERAAARRRAGPCAADARRGREDRRSRGLRQEHPRAARPDHGLRPPRLPRRGSTFADPQADGAGGRLAAHRGRRGAGGSGARCAPRAKAGLRDRDERRVLLGRGAGRGRGAARPDARDVRVLRASPAGRRTSSRRSGPGGCSGPPAQYVGPPERSLSAV